MVQASCEVGSTAKLRPCDSARFVTCKVMTPASARTVGTAVDDTFELTWFNGTECIEFFGVDDGAVLIERYSAAGVAGAAAARDDGEPKIDASGNHVAHLGFTIRSEARPEEIPRASRWRL